MTIDRGYRIPLLDHGFITFIESWGSDARIIEAARMSTDKGFLGWDRETFWVCPLCGYILVNDRDPAVGSGAVSTVDLAPSCPKDGQLLRVDTTKSHPGDTRLLRYLYKHKHGTPFEMAGMTIVVQAPLFVFREWHRHRTQSYNEMSARYVPLPDVNYVPSADRCFGSATANRQAQAYSDTELSRSDVDTWLSDLTSLYEHAQRVYNKGLQLGIPKEVARLPVPVARYSRMMASTDLRNWLGFLTLRLDENAQWEIRQYANAVGVMISELFPRTWDLFVHGPHPQESRHGLQHR